MLTINWVGITFLRHWLRQCWIDRDKECVMIATLSLFIMAFAAEATAPTATASPAAAENKVTCRRYPVTGSLAVKKKVCHTKREWARATEDAQAEADRLVTHVSTERGN
ncbi:MAG: hypothetical protein ACREB5_01970 [Sphingomonadaceae bacterium]